MLKLINFFYNFFCLKNKNKYKSFDENNNLIYEKDCCGYWERWWEYDENNNLIYKKYAHGGEFWYKYDEKSNWAKITEKEYKEIEFQKVKKLEYKRKIEKRSSRFELIEI